MNIKTLLSENDLPKNYYNIIADLPTSIPPVLHPGTKKPVGPEDLSPLFPMELIKQEVSNSRFIEIPDEVIDIYKLYRPTPLYRARSLEKILDTPAKIYYKYEGVSPQVVTNQILQSLRHIIIRKKALKELQQKLVQVNGVHH